MWFVDDADELFDPFRTDEQALSFTHALADESVSVVFAVSTIRPIRIPEHCNTRIVFPCGERTSDLMAGVPARLLDMMSHIDADNAGRAVLIVKTSVFSRQNLLKITTVRGYLGTGLKEQHQPRGF